MKTLSYQTFKSQTLSESTVAPEEGMAGTFSNQEPLAKKPKTLIIIPAYNEEKNIGAVLKGIKQKLPEIPILVINDGSSDNTESVVLEHNAEVIHSHSILVMEWLYKRDLFTR